MRELTYSEISAVLRHEDGVLYWRVTCGSVRGGSVAGHKDRQGYVALQFSRRFLFAHRVIWLLVYGEWPAAMLDHIDGDRANNKPANLRPATNAENQRNRVVTGKVPFKGVVRHLSGKFQASCSGVYLGVFNTAEDAARAYDKAAAERFGQFARLNFSEAAS